MNNNVNEQFHKTKTNHIDNKRQHDNYEQCTNRHIAKFVCFIDIVFILQRKFVENN